MLLSLHPHSLRVEFDSVAQLVEHYTFNVRALGSNPSGITEKPRFTWLFCFVMLGRDASGLVR
jgi:hypothetical protein